MNNWNPDPLLLTAQDLMRDVKVLIPLGMSVRSAGDLLEAANIEVAPVVDSGGRCVGLFSMADYRYWLDLSETWNRRKEDHNPVSEHPASDQVRHNINGNFKAVMPDAGVEELVQRLNGTENPFLVILDRQARPRGIVNADDVLAADSEINWAKGELAMAN